MSFQLIHHSSSDTTATDTTGGDTSTHTSTSTASGSTNDSSTDAEPSEDSSNENTEEGQLRTKDPQSDLSSVPRLVDIIIDATRYVKGL